MTFDVTGHSRGYRDTAGIGNILFFRTGRVLGTVFFCLMAIIAFSQETKTPPKNVLLPRKINPLCYISVPFQNNFDFNVPPNNGFRWTMYAMPIIPISLGKKLELINRIVLPVQSQVNIYGNSSQTGLGDLLINTFLSPKPGRFVWGIGPSFYFPTGFPDLLSTKKWAAGPGGICAIQTRKLTLAFLLFHLWSYAGNSDRKDFSYTWIQPLLVYTIYKGWGVGVTSETGYEWLGDVTNGAVIITGQYMLKTGKQYLNFVLGPKIYYGNFNQPQWGFRATVNILFP